MIIITRLQEDLKKLGEEINRKKAKENYRKRTKKNCSKSDLTELQSLIELRKQIKDLLSHERAIMRRAKQQLKHKQTYVSKKSGNSYRVENGVAIFTTNQKNPVEFMVDEKDIELVLKRRWHAHKYINGNVYIVSRYKDSTGHFRRISLLKALGYNRNYTFKNGNVFDFRRDNICMKGYIANLIYNKEEE